MDEELLFNYAVNGSDLAFGRLVARYRQFVYALCLRELREHTLAEDATQAVFLLLAEKARGLPADTVVARWLFHAARLISKNHRRKESRRQHFERSLAVEEPYSAGAGVSVVSGLLNDALEELNEGELDVVLLRFVDGLSMSEIGSKVGVSADSARKRVSRAVEKMQGCFERAGAIRNVIQTKGAIKSMLTETEAVNQIDGRYQEIDDAYASKDEQRIRETIDRVFAAGFHVFTQDGTLRGQDRDQVIRDLPAIIAGGPKESEREHNVQLVSLSGNMATVDVNLRVVRPEKSPSVLRLQEVDVWICEDDGWKLLVCREGPGGYHEV